VFTHENVDEGKKAAKIRGKQPANTLQRASTAKASYPRETSLSQGALLRGVGRSPRDEEGEGTVYVEGMWRLFLACVRGGPLLFFLPPLPLFFFLRRR